MNEYSFTYVVSAAAQAIAEGKSTDEINLLSAFFTQLGDTLATICAVKAINESDGTKPS